MLHVNEVDHDQPRHIAQAQLTGNFLCRLQIGGGRCLLNPVFAGRTTGVYVDRNQGFGRVDDQIAAGFQLNHRLIKRVELIFDAVTLIQRHRICIRLHALGVAWH